IGAPACSSALLRMHMLNKYQEAELVAAREAACKGIFIVPAASGTYDGSNQDSMGRVIEPTEPGMTQVGNPGDSITQLDPNHPTTAYPDFTKSVIRGFSSGLGVSYNSLANDLEGVNFSSIRAGLLEEREEWKAVQQ